MGGVRNIEWDSPSKALPSFLTIAIMVLTYNISYGIAFGMISSLIIKIFSGKIKEIHPATWIISILFALLCCLLIIAFFAIFVLLIRL